MRLIDADELIEIAHRIRLDSRERIERMIESAPTVDAIEVVRCKDCKFAHLTYDKDAKYCDFWRDDDDFLIEVYLPSDHYCAYGERREDETD